MSSSISAAIDIVPESDAHPCLPPHLLRNLISEHRKRFPTSPSIYAKSLQDFRKGVLSHRAVLNGEQATTQSILDSQSMLDEDEDEDAFSLWSSKVGGKRTWLHIAAAAADLPLAHECVRLGLDLDFRDSKGMTPLYLACECLISVDLLELLAEDEESSQMLLTRMQGYIDFAYFLVRQHADVNAICGENTALSIVCRSRCWDLVELLLQHRADPQLPPAKDLFSLIANDCDKETFATLIRQTEPCRNGHPRPPRLCPCWSGKRLSECHAAKDIPYPQYFYCDCGSGELYGQCCALRGIERMERWYEPEKKIILTYTLSAREPKENLLDTLSRVREYAQTHHSHERVWTEATLKALERHKVRIGWFLNEERLAEKAFNFAMQVVPFTALPFENLPRSDRKAYAAKWNRAVDVYITSGCDHRRRIEVEQVAKVDNSGCALYKRCGYSKCKNVETENGQKFKRCAACSRIFYCSPKCQRADWKTHKDACKDRSFPGHMLPSQIELKKSIEVLRDQSLHRIQVTGDIAAIFGGDYSDYAAIFATASLEAMLPGI